MNPDEEKPHGEFPTNATTLNGEPLAFDGMSVKAARGEQLALNLGEVARTQEDGSSLRGRPARPRGATRKSQVR